MPGADSYTDPDFAAAALVTIDTQRDVLDGGPLEIPGTSAALESMRLLAQKFREAGRPIVHVVRLYEPRWEQRRSLPPRARNGRPGASRSMSSLAGRQEDECRIHRRPPNLRDARGRDARSANRIRERSRARRARRRFAASRGLQHFARGL